MGPRVFTDMNVRASRFGSQRARSLSFPVLLSERKAASRRLVRADIEMS